MFPTEGLSVKVVRIVLDGLGTNVLVQSDSPAYIKGLSEAARLVGSQRTKGIRTARTNKPTAEGGHKGETK